MIGPFESRAVNPILNGYFPDSELRHSLIMVSKSLHIWLVRLTGL